MIKSLVFSVSTALLLGGIALPAQAQQANPEACVDQFDPDVDYFPDQVEARHSAFWSISYHGNYKLLNVDNSEFPDEGSLTYVLVQCGTPAPALEGDLEGALVIEVPVDRTAITHNNGLAMLDEIGAVSTVAGVANGMVTSAPNSPWFAGMLEAAGEPENIGTSSGLDFERILGLEADVLIMAGFGPGYTEIADARGRGLPALMVSNRIEPTPLGSAEWLKALSALYNLEAVANERFDAIEAGYEEVVATVGGMLDPGYSAAYACIGDQRGCDFMYAHGPRSLNGQILETLGVTNPFAEGNDAGNGMTFDFEQSLGRAADTDFFIVYYELAMNAEMIANDTRFHNFPALVEGNYIAGRDDNYAECGATSYIRVDRLIRDYAIGMRPDLFPGEEGGCFIRP